VAEHLASAGRQVHLIDRYPHIGDNAYDEYVILVHRHGPRIFTNSKRIVDYLSNFTEWRR
jgi:UDP-galactopyranose mutase